MYVYICTMYIFNESLPQFSKFQNTRNWFNSYSNKEKTPPKRWNINTNAKEPHSEQTQ